VEHASHWTATVTLLKVIRALLIKTCLDMHLQARNEYCYIVEYTTYWSMNTAILLNTQHTGLWILLYC